MTFDQLRYFCAAARFEHVGKAARSVAISPSAVSTAISALEEELGRALFLREGKSMSLSDHGRYLRDAAEQLFEHLSEIECALRGADAAVRGHYRLGASPFLAARYLAGAWRGFAEDHPGLTSDLSAMNSAAALSAVVDGTLDLALVFSPTRHPELREIEFHRGELLLVVGRRHPLAKRRRPVAGKELSEYPATIHKGSPGVDLCEMHPMFERFGIEPKIRCSFDSDDLAIETLRDQESWSLLPDLVVSRYRSELTALPRPRGFRAPYRVAAVLLARRAENRTLALLVERLRSLFAI